MVNAIEDNKLVASAVLSGNRNFEGRVHANTRANYLASPPLVVAYALAGTVALDLTSDPIGTGSNGQPVYLRDIWPTQQEVSDIVGLNVTPEMFRNRYDNVFGGTEQWRAIAVDAESDTYRWNGGSTYVQNPPYFEGITMETQPLASIRGARVLALLGDNITTDHISPAGNIRKTSPAGEYLLEHQVRPFDFNSYGARRGNHEVMMRGTFANIRIKNEMLDNVEGGFSRHYPSGDVAPIYDVAMRYKAEGTPLVIFGGKEYGMGSSRDWAAKGTFLLGVKAVVVESFERIHRSNLVGMGVLPLVFRPGETRQTLGLRGDEVVDILGVEDLRPRMELEMVVTRADGTSLRTGVQCRVDTADEVEYYRNGGILHYVLREMAKAA
jgi:aconitate hydratase